MKKVTIDALRKASASGSRVLDKDGLDVRFPLPSEKRTESPALVHVDKKRTESPALVHAQPVVDSIDRLAQALAKVLKANQATADSVSAALSFLTEQKPEPRPASYDVAIKRDKDGKMKSLVVTPK